MSTTSLSQPSPISSMRSSFSSYDSINAERKGKLVDLLTRPRANGGYSGHINYHEFSILGYSLNWTREIIEDCWYDILCGVPNSEATDMEHVADVICDYCSPAALLSSMAPLAPPCLGDPDPAEGPPKSAVPSVGVKSVDGGSHSPVPPVFVPTVAAAAAAAEVRSRSVPKTCREGTDKCASSAQGNNKRHNNTSRFTSSVGRSSKLATPGNDSPGYKRYAVQTASSKLKLRMRDRPSPAASVDFRAALQPTPGKPERSLRASDTSQRSAVFDRLYIQGKKLQLEKKSWTKPLEEMPSFKPNIAPYRGKSHAKEGDADVPHYYRLTRTYCAKLMRQPDRFHDPLDDTPATARVDIRAPPGPSCFVPPGYVEGVARLRRGVASRQHHDFEAGLRQDSCSNGSRDHSRAAATQYLETPILRLPLFTIEKGARESVDVRLALPDDKASYRSNDAYMDGKAPLATASRPRSFSALSSCGSYYERFKAH